MTSSGHCIHVHVFLSRAEGLSPTEKRQIAMISESIEVLSGKLAAGEVAADVVRQIEELVAALTVQNYGAANSIQAVRVTVSS